MAPGPFHSGIGTADVSTIRAEAYAIGPPEIAIMDDTTDYATTPTLTLLNSNGEASTTVIEAVKTLTKLTGFTVVTDNGDYTATGTISVSGGTPTNPDASPVRTFLASEGNYNLASEGLDVVLYSKYQPGAAFDYIARDANSGVYIKNALYRTDATTDVGAFQSWAGMRFAGIKLYGAAMFKFAGALPTDVDTAAWWMGTEWKNGNRYIYPNARNWL